ncbi:MAG: hypothetical protein GXO92_03890 [FCB group bacterium]|nr:hypothetical protein [FCB group bacterium]
MMKRILIPIICSLLFAGILAGKNGKYLSKAEYYNQFVAPEKGQSPIYLEKVLGFGDRKRSVLDRGNMVLRMSNAAIYGYDRWGLNHEFPAGSMSQDGCCTYYWTQSPIVGALINGQPSVAVGVRGSLRDSEEEFEPLPGYDAGYVDVEANIGIALSDNPASWPDQWPIEKDPTGTYTDPITGESFPGIEPPLHDNIRFPVPPFMKETFPADDPDKRMAYFVVTDNDPQEGNTLASNGVGPLNVRFDVWVVNDASVFANDGLIFIQLMTNVGTDTLKELYMGIAGDPDTPEQGGQEWTDDLAMFIEPNDPHINEKLIDASDPELLENFALVWDSDDKAEGFKSAGVGWIGLKFLEATKINRDGTTESYDASTFYTFEYSQDAQSDAQAYNEQLKAGIQTPHNIEPYGKDKFKKPYSYGPDITWVIAAGPMEVAPGEQVIFTFADFMGINEADLIKNAKLFQSYYDLQFRTPKPPMPPPSVHAIASDAQVVLFWDADSTEISVDPVTGVNAFEGYRIYRSTDRGKTWGKIITDVNGNPSGHYQPLAIYDLPNGITGPFPMYPIGDYYYALGTDAGLQYSFVDNNVVNGYEYWYAVCAYDHKDPKGGILGIPLENSKSANAFIPGDNTVAVIPQAEPAGFDAGKVEQTTHTKGQADAVIITLAANPFTSEPELQDFLFQGIVKMTPSDYTSKYGHDYKVVFRTDEDNTPYWTLVDITINDTIVPYETDISSNYNYLIDGFIPIFKNATWVLTLDSINSVINDADTTTKITFTVGHPNGLDATWAGFLKNIPVEQPSGNAIYEGLDKTIEIRFTESGSIGTYFHPSLASTDTVFMPLEVWDVNENKQLNYAIYPTSPGKPLYEPQSDTTDTYVFTKNIYVIPVYEDYDPGILPYHFAQDAPLLGWMIYFNKKSNAWEYGNSITLTVYSTKPIIPGEDEYIISTIEPNTVVEKGDLDNILVVPNPYVVSSVYETNVEVKEIQFTHLPDVCVIRIYNMAGELVRLLKHEPGSEGYRGPSVEAWNLRTYNDQEVSFGVYIFHVTADEQEKIGKFAVIR